MTTCTVRANLGGFSAAGFLKGMKLHQDFGKIAPRHGSLGGAQAPNLSVHGSYPLTGFGMVRNECIECQNCSRFKPSTTEWAKPGRITNCRSPFGSRL
jgi:hypothetical protein